MELGAERIEELEAAGPLGRLSMLRARVRELKNEKEKMLLRLKRTNDRHRDVYTTISNINPESSCEDLRRELSNLRLRVLDQ